MTTAPAADVASAMITSGSENAGGDPAVFVTTTENVPVVVPKPLDIEQVTVVVPTGNREPDGGLQLAPPASYATFVPDDDVVSAVTTSGSERTGGVFALRWMRESVTGPIVRVPLPVSVAFTVTE